MRVKASGGGALSDMLAELGICSEEVLLFLDGKLVPETAHTEKGQTIDIIRTKHGWDSNIAPGKNIPKPDSTNTSAGGLKNTCSSCGKPAVAYLPAMRRHYCASHFNEYFEKKVKRSIRERGMIKKGEKVALGLSGGKDSTSMLHSLSKVRKSLPFELIAITIDEGIKGYRDSTIANAEKEAKALGVEHHVFSFKDEYGKTLDSLLKGTDKPGCSVCGVLRRRLLNKKARELGATKLAIAHNLDDLVQTIMLNLMRNEPLRFSRMELPLVENPKLVPRIKPQMMLTEKEVSVYAVLHGHEFGPACCCPHVEGAMRKQVKGHMNSLEEKFPGTKAKMAAAFFAVQKDMRRGMEGEYEMGSCSKCGEPSAEGTCMACRMLKR